MDQPNRQRGTRRDFLTGRAVRSEIEQRGEALAEEITEAAAPSGGDTIRLQTRAMACNFAALLNPGPSRQVMTASDGLDLVHELEDQMSVFREDSELSRLNRRAIEEPVLAETRLFGLLLEARRISRETEGCFDATSGPVIALWRQCRRENRIPTEDELAAVLEQTGMEHVHFEETGESVRFDRPGIRLDLGGIGKGYALDRAGEFLHNEEVESWLLHGGHSSVLASGDHNRQGGWPVGLRNPLFPKRRLATILLQDRAMATSGSGVQYFRHQGQRYGHILDPRSGWPVDGMLSVTVLAPTAAEADALSTAFFVGGLAKARAYCHNHPEVSVWLIPQPQRGRRLEPVALGMPEETLFPAEELPSTN